jgi:hypothetical protein
MPWGTSTTHELILDSISSRTLKVERKQPNPVTGSISWVVETSQTPRFPLSMATIRNKFEK